MSDWSGQSTNAIWMYFRLRESVKQFNDQTQHLQGEDEFLIWTVSERPDRTELFDHACDANTYALSPQTAACQQSVSVCIYVWAWTYGDREWNDCMQVELFSFLTHPFICMLAADWTIERSNDRSIDQSTSIPHYHRSVICHVSCVRAIPVECCCASWICGGMCRCSILHPYARSVIDDSMHSCVHACIIAAQRSLTAHSLHVNTSIACAHTQSLISECV